MDITAAGHFNLLLVYYMDTVGIHWTQHHRPNVRGPIIHGHNNNAPCSNLISHSGGQRPQLGRSPEQASQHHPQASHHVHQPHRRRVRPCRRRQGGHQEGEVAQILHFFILSY